MLLANVPYVPTGDLGLMPAEARLHEPVGTLDGGPDGLDVLRRVAAEAPRWLAPGGHLLTEASSPSGGGGGRGAVDSGAGRPVVTSEEHDATVVVGTARTMTSRRTTPRSGRAHAERTSQRGLPLRRESAAVSRRVARCRA